MMSQIFSAAFGIYVLFTVSWQGGAAVLATFGLIAGYLFVFMMYVTNNFYLTRPWQMLSYFLTILACWLGLAVGLSENDREKLNIFAGFTVSFFTVVAIILLLTSVELYQSFRSMKLKPIFFSPWVFPIYKYDTLNDRLVKYNRIGLQVFSIVVLIMIYSVICVIWVFPVSAGIAIGSFCEVLGALIFIYITGISPLQLGTAYKFVNPSSHPKSIKKAWQEAKENYLKKKGVNRVDDFASYAEIKEKIRDLCLIAESMRNGTAFEIPNKNENKA